jgi:ferredoxin
LSFLALFVFLAVETGFPPSTSPPANIFLKADPFAAVVSTINGVSASLVLSFWPAWVLLGLTALSGRFFCAWICPLGTCFDVVGAVKPKSLRYEPHGREMKRKRSESGRGVAPARRVRLKYFLLASVLLLSLVGVNLLYFASPLVIMERSIYLVLLPQVPVLLLALLALSFAYRSRFWCEELCPMGALMSLVSMAGKRLKAWVSPLSVVKDSGSCIDCGACYKTCDFGVDEPFLKLDDGRLRSADCTVCGNCVSACPAAGALELDTFGAGLYTSRGTTGAKRAGRSAGPSGAGGEQRSGGKVAASSPPAGDEPGAEGRLTVSRGEFIGSLGLGAVLLAGYGLGVRGTAAFPLLRMPGAQDEAEFLARCNRCQACTRTCPTTCIKPMGLEDGLQKLWTPRFEPRTASCVFDQCDQACARVCPAGAIERQKPEDVRIGTAYVDRNRCLGWKGQMCLVCQERCRFNAIEAKGLRPVVLEDKCTGCGACEQTCPTGTASIRVFPVGVAPSWPEGGGQRRGGKQ